MSPENLDTQRAMPEAFTSQDPVQLVRDAIDASDRGDYDATMRLFAPDVVWQSLDGPGGFEGAMTVRRFLEHFPSAYDSFEQLSGERG
jgi:ketosteroid isomerase-like protein